MLESSILPALHVTLDYFIVINLGGMAILFALALIILIRQGKLNKKYKKFMTGAKGYNLEKIVLEQRDEIEKINESIANHDDYITTISSHFSKVYSKIHIMKYDAFKEVGGNMSFVLVLLDMKNNGIIINSIRSTDGNYIYLKEVESGNCDTPLCKEEAVALEETIKKTV